MMKRKFAITFIVEVNAEMLLTDKNEAAQQVAEAITCIWDGDNTKDDNFFVDSYNFEAEEV